MIENAIAPLCHCAIVPQVIFLALSLKKIKIYLYINIINKVRVFLYRIIVIVFFCSFFLIAPQKTERGTMAQWHNGANNNLFV